jgi:hypothetical protein
MEAWAVHGPLEAQLTGVAVGSLPAVQRYPPKGNISRWNVTRDGYRLWNTTLTEKVARAGAVCLKVRPDAFITMLADCWASLQPTGINMEEI